MTSMKHKKILLAILMVVVAFVANYARPTRYLAQSSPRNLLVNDVPTKFKDWTKIATDEDMIIDPAQQVVLNYLYADILNASYVNPQDRTVMLSIAYGKDQSEGHDVHKPELCYPAQGFTKLEELDIPIALDTNRTILVHYMKMQKGQRIEPLFYWTLAGDYLYRNKMNKRRIAFQYSLDNLIPDGMIVRVSTLEANNAIAQKSLIDFVKDWYASIPEEQRTRYFGLPES